MWIVVVCLVTAILAVGIGHWFYRWGNPNCNGKLPPGTMGLPIVGETLQFVVPDAICDISPFIRKKMARYGPIFRTSLFGEKTIVCTDPDINHYIIQQEGRSVLLWYTEALNKVFGQQGILAQHGAIHKHLKHLILRLVGPENLKANILTELDALIGGHLQSWARLATVDLKKATEDMLFDYAARKLISYDESKTPMKFQENFNAFMYGLFSFPLDIPGTKYNKCVQGRKNSMKIIKGIIKERKSSKMSHGDFLNHLLEEIEREDSFLNEAHVVDMVILILFAVQETTSTSSTLVLKFISKHPDVLAELTKEHEAILKIRRDTKESDMITWEEYKSMTFTHMVITELVRLANFSPALCRKVIRDVEVNGYTIPAGWLFMIIPSVVHLDPDVYPDPLTFNPWRWQNEWHAASKTFLGFGFGARYCPGADFVRLQMAIFIHHLVTKYRWKIIGGSDQGIIRLAGLVFPKGLPIELSEKYKQ